MDLFSTFSTGTQGVFGIWVCRILHVLLTGKSGPGKNSWIRSESHPKESQ